MSSPQGPRVQDREYLDHLQTEPCLFTGVRGDEYETVDPMHIGTYARGMKTDNEAIPVRHRFHSQGHASGEISMIREHAPDWLLREAMRAYAREMYRGWLEQGEAK